MVVQPWLSPKQLGLKLSFHGHGLLTSQKEQDRFAAYQFCKLRRPDRREAYSRLEPHLGGVFDPVFDHFPSVTRIFLDQLV